ncbi:uncharacterized protein LOC130589846 [Beta vulgaris subsp. vulgaris]|uniref:uncharacterized protein LOC130589846 n=1 Tax=Beta vulgaris subsp. vulgaris TaxID=3555 RepID=UPI002548F221|nr:uncharacterized protein LOC130589846 [Beta vulgaris subsp. vulgaris]
MSNIGVENEVVVEDHVRIEGDDVVGDENDNGDNSDTEDEEFGDRIGEMLEGARDHFNERPRVFDSFSEAAGKPLYPGCTKYTQLSGILTLFNIKAKHNLTDVGFTELLEALHDMFPEGNLLPKSTYYAKKLMCPLGLEYERIDACPNDCMLYRNEYADLYECPRCGKSRYKLPDGVVPGPGNTGPSAKVLWYLPVVPRFRRLFSLKKMHKT